MDEKTLKLWAITVTITLFLKVSSPAGQEKYPLWDIEKILSGQKFVDLTHDFSPGIPHWPGFPEETRKTIYWYEKRPDTMGSGFYAEVFTHVGQWGTPLIRRPTS